MKYDVKQNLRQCQCSLFVDAEAAQIYFSPCPTHNQSKKNDDAGAIKSVQSAQFDSHEN